MRNVAGPDIELLRAVRRARDLADRDFSQPLTLDALAGAANYSKFHFARAFAAAYGETPMAYLTRRRIERAKDLLRGANLTVTEIALLVGFESLGSFSSRFRSWSAYRPASTDARRTRRRRYRAASSSCGRGQLRNPEEAPPPFGG